MITISADETATICEALRYQASDMSTVAPAHRRLEVNALRKLANDLEYRIAMQSLHAGEKDDE